MSIQLATSSCSNKRELRFGDIDDFNAHRVSIIQPDSFAVFGDLIRHVDELSCLDSIPSIYLETKKVNKTIALSSICWFEHGCILIKPRNRLLIRDGQVQLGRSIGLDSLDEVMRAHYLNYGELEQFSEDPRKALVSIQFSGHDFGSLQEIVDKITDSFLKLKLDVDLILTLEDLDGSSDELY